MKIVEYGFNLDRIKKIQTTNNINSDILNFLINKGYSDEEILLLTSNKVESVLDNDNISYVKEASYLINDFLVNDNAKVFIFSDYDSDGINAGFIFYDCLNQLVKALKGTCEVDLYIPERTEGYGLSMKWCKDLVSNKLTKDILVVTSDNGVSKKDEVAFLKANGIEVLITDHHRPQDDIIPQDVIIVDPCLNDIGNKNAEGLCGTAVVYKICSYLLNEMYSDKSNYSDVYLPHVAIATITDMMPITSENIIYVKNGIDLINKKYCNKALQYYIDYKGSPIIPKDIAFELGPQINSCGRMGEVSKAINLLLESDDDNVVDMYNDMVVLNDSRKETTKQIAELCQEKIAEIVKDDDQIIILRIKGAGGVAGNVANQLLKIYDKPVILLNDDDTKKVLTGSCRSANVNLQDLLKKAQDKGLINSFGGHNEAAGINICKDNIKSFKEFCNKKISKDLLDNKENEVEKTMYVDKIVNVADLNMETIKKYSDILYFNSLEGPLFALKDVCIDKITSSKNNPNNLCFFFRDKNTTASKGLWCWKFKGTYDNIGNPTKVNLVFSLSNFKSMLVMDIKHIEAS